MSGWLLLLACGLLASTRAAEAQCPWDHQVSELQSSCICAYNLLQQLSVQCDMVEYQTLLKALDKFGRSTSIDLLYVNNSTVRSLASGAFKHLKLTNLQLSSCKIRTVSPGAFDGLYGSLKNLYLQDNEIEDLPVESLRHMKNLTTLDLSKNRLSKIPDNAFSTLKSLTTLKLSDNNLTISRNAFDGLEDSLKNLNLKGSRQKKVPDAVRGLKTLAFLDLAQNGIHDLPGPGAAAIFEGLHSLTALNLERNVIQSVGGETFQAISDTLSSLSLLNNLLTEFPSAALRPLHELRVLDIGFNLLTELPEDSFQGNPSLTLLALDGNPLSTVPGGAVGHLNTTLRGLSLGGRFLHCDCRLRWVADWIRRGDLQVTSRERNPQFCGSPPRLADRSFYTIEPDELECAPTKAGIAEPVVEDEELLEEGGGEENLPEIGVGVGYVEPEVSSSSASSTISSISSSVSTTTISSSKKTEGTTSATSTTTSTTTSERPTFTSRTSKQTSTHRPESTTVRKGSVVLSRSTPWPTSGAAPGGGRPPLVLPPRPSTQDVLVRSAHRQDSSVVIQWDSGTSNILGFRVVYRLFGDKSFKQGPPLEATEREFKIKNVPSQECIIVCVISLEEINVTPETVPYGQCREVRTVSSAANNMDKITIAASAAICGTVVIAVIIFVAASRRRSRKLHTLDGGMERGKIPVVGGLPVACCPASSPGPLSSLATLNAFTSHKDWDQVSVYSNRSLGRPHQHNGGNGRLYHMERQGSMTRGCVGDDMRYNGKNTKTRSVADGQSQHSFSNNSGRYLNGNAFTSGLVSSRPELRQSRQSLAVSERMSRVSYPTGRRRSRGREQSGGGGGARPGSRYSTAGSTHTLNYCGDTSDNWTDHDMDIYMARNPTTRGGLVPL